MRYFAMFGLAVVLFFWVLSPQLILEGMKHSFWTSCFAGFISGTLIVALYILLTDRWKWFKG